MSASAHWRTLMSKAKEQAQLMRTMAAELYKTGGVDEYTPRPSVAHWRDVVSWFPHERIAELLAMAEAMEAEEEVVNG